MTTYQSRIVIKDPKAKFVPGIADTKKVSPKPVVKPKAKPYSRIPVKPVAKTKYTTAGMDDK